MKITIAILLMGTLIGSVAACNIASCTLTGTLTGTAGCTNYQTYINCLNTQKNSCTSSATDMVAKPIIEAAITSNTALRAALSCSALLGSEATCNLGSCSLTGTLTGVDGCTNYQDYINCLTTQSGTCTSSLIDEASKRVIDSAISTNTVLRAALGCSGASLTTISSIALILSIVVTLMKTHL
ncbi:uncharacterized protein [Haliotis asinina]|uniref:uncharacterized protein n=1 Tax=Haliotis asinina TaxID=109174 RepID=UPI003531A33C